MNSSDRRAQAESLFAQARRAIERQDALLALRFADEAAAIDPDIAELNLIRASCLGAIGRLDEAQAAIEAELVKSPGSAQAQALREKIRSAIARRAAAGNSPRRWESAIPREMIQTTERAAHQFTYRGLPLIKNPFDFALYSLLLWKLQPRTVFEVGSFSGASALWMADLLGAYGVDFQIHSVDLAAVTAVRHDRIHFHAGSGRSLGQVFSPELLADSQRPFLVIDDADHTRETSAAVLEFFDPILHVGDYIVVEDGLTAAGPREALFQFLSRNQLRYLVDSEYCDFFGYNATWCINGFLKRIA